MRNAIYLCMWTLQYRISPLGEHHTSPGARPCYTSHGQPALKSAAHELGFCTNNQRRSNGAGRSVVHSDVSLTRPLKLELLDTGISVTGISATGISATGISATGISATINSTHRYRSIGCSWPCCWCTILMHHFHCHPHRPRRYQ